MRFFMPPGLPVSNPEEAFRELLAFTQDVTGWLIHDERVYSVEYMESGKVKSATVGDQGFGGTVQCIFDTDLVVMVCTAQGSRLGSPVMVDKRNVVNLTWFEDFAPADAVKPKTSEPPMGLITFLFTDIEGSTLHWEEDPVGMRSALVRHDTLMENVVSGNFGFVFKTMGDQFCAAFHNAADAVQAAIDAQLALSESAWPEQIVFKVRMAVHTGVADIRGNDYFGPPLNYTARLMGAAHGGQVLLSGEAYDASRSSFPRKASVALLGIHQLKDLCRPLSILQLFHPGLRTTFPPLRGVETVPPGAKAA
jgi:class 3 adenylate cyclase